jgi:hypothetical protein
MPLAGSIDPPVTTWAISSALVACTSAVRSRMSLNGARSWFKSRKTSCSSPTSLE